MAVAPRAKPEDFFSPQQWAEVSGRSQWRGLWLVAHCWAVIGLAMACAVVWPILIPVAVVIIGCRQLGLAILMHDAAHASLHANRKVNDFVAYWFCSPALLRYRPYHLMHHRFVQQTEDPDLILSAPFPISADSLKRKMLRDLSGQTFWKQRLSPALQALMEWTKAKAGISAGASQARAGSTESQEKFHAQDLRFLAGQAIGLAVFSIAGYGWAWFVLWLLPMATWLPFISRLRNIAEHALVPQNEPSPFRQARTTHASWLARMVLAPYWVNYHNEHHLFTQVPCWNLPKAHALLKAQGVTSQMTLGTGYLSVLRQAAGANA